MSAEGIGQEISGTTAVEIQSCWMFSDVHFGCQELAKYLESRYFRAFSQRASSL